MRTIAKLFSKREVAILFCVVVLSLLLSPSFLASALTPGVSGWAWSDNIGWVSFAEVDIDENGNFVGYAWSDTVGWINFDPVGPYPVCPTSVCPHGSPDYSARIDLNGNLPGCANKNDVCGWARAVHGGTGWNGWILVGPIFSGGNNHGVRVDTGTDPRELMGYAWGSEIIGWISFNCRNNLECPRSDYKVTVFFNSAPTIPSAESSIRYCDHLLAPQVATGVSVTLSWTYHDADGDPQNKYEIHVSEDPNFPSGNSFERVVNSSAASYSLNLSDDPTWKSALNFNTTYHWRVRVHDGNSWSEWRASHFTIARSHPSPFVIFSYSPEQISVNAIITFTSEKWDNDLNELRVSQVYDGSTPIYNWSFGGGTPSLASSSSTATTTFKEAGAWSATLRVTDASGYFCCRTEPLEIRLPLPDWREVFPFGRARLFLASAIDQLRFLASNGKTFFTKL